MRRYILILILIPMVAAVVGPARPAAARPDCAGAIARFRAITNNDVATGNLNRSVYEQIEAGLPQVILLCRHGDDRQSLAALTQLEHRYGYH